MSLLASILIMCSRHRWPILTERRTTSLQDGSLTMKLNSRVTLSTTQTFLGNGTNKVPQKDNIITLRTIRLLQQQTQIWMTRVLKISRAESTMKSCAKWKQQSLLNVKETVAVRENHVKIKLSKLILIVKNKKSTLLFLKLKRKSNVLVKQQM